MRAGRVFLNRVGDDFDWSIDPISHASKGAETNIKEKQCNDREIVSRAPVFCTRLVIVWSVGLHFSLTSTI